MRSFAVLGVLAALSAGAVAQQIPIPPFVSTFSGQLTRGFWFQSPVACIITGVRVPDESLQGVQCVEIDRLATAPPAYPGTIAPTQLFFANNQPSANILPTNILVNAGDFIGVLGACGTATMNNSYGATGAFNSTILGQPVVLTRFLTQFNLSTTSGNQLCSSEVAGSFGRVEVYVSPAGPGVASAIPYGTGCYAPSTPPTQSQCASIYESFATSAALDLGNSAITWLPTGGGGYVMLPGITTYVTPSGTATSVAFGDDIEQVVALTGSFPFDGGTTSSLAICSNGFVSVATGNGTSFSPAAASMLSAPLTGWWNWHDYNPTTAGSGLIKFEEIAGVAYITWDGVWDYGGASTANANTFQFQFDETTGMVHLVFQTMSLLGSNRVVGYSPGGASLDPGNRDISATLPAAFSLSPSTNEGPALALAASARPLIGTSINLVTSNIPAGTALGASLLGLAQFNPGIDLTVIGMPGCSKYTDGSVTQIFLVGGSTASVVFNIPNVPAYVGIHVFAESATFSAGFNALGVIASNGLDLGIGNL
jgi:hypothetical protein